MNQNGGWTLALAMRFRAEKGTSNNWTRPFILWNSGQAEYRHIGWYLNPTNGAEAMYCGSTYYNSQYGYYTNSGFQSYGNVTNSNVWWIKVFSFSGSIHVNTSSGYSSGGGSVTGSSYEYIYSGSNNSSTGLTQRFVGSKSWGTVSNCKVTNGMASSYYRWNPTLAPTYWNYWSGGTNPTYDIMHFSFYGHALSSTKQERLAENLANEYLGGY